MRFDYLLGFMLEVVVIVVVAKLVRDVLLKLRGYDVNEEVTRRRSVGAATSQAGYLIGVLLGTLGAIPVTGNNPSFLGTAGGVALAGLVAIVLQLVADIVSDKLIFRGVDAPEAKVKGATAESAASQGAASDVNLTLALGKAAVSVATGLVLRGALSDAEMGLLGRVAWFAVGQAVMIVAVLLYCRLTPYDDLAEIKRDNLAAGFPIAGILLAVGLIMEAAVAGKPTGSLSQAFLQFGKFLGVSLVLVYVLRRITDIVMLPKVKLSRAIVEERNVAAGVQEGLSFLLASLIVTFFLT
jgi:uncharacterized membrane protein YjfL (UPF0719 family)